MNDTNVLIVGAGPVGLTLAIDLAWRGIDVTVVETRARFLIPSRYGDDLVIETSFVEVGNTATLSFTVTAPNACGSSSWLTFAAAVG